MKSLDQARQLARTMVDIGQGAGRKVVAVLSDMNQPLGRTVGNALEVREALDTLQGRGPADLEELSVLLAAHMVKVGGQADSLEEALLKVRTLLQTRAGLMSFQQMVEAQGGSLDLTRPDYGLPQASEIAGVTFTNQGYVKAIDALAVGRTVMRLGAGRERLEDRIFPEVGVELHKKVGDRINSNDIVATIYARDKSQLAQAAAEIKQAYTLTDTPPDPVSLVFDTIT